MTILRYIPTGSRSPVTRTSLMAQTRMTDRVVRDMIHRERRRGARIVSSSKGRGYHLAESEEEWQTFVAETRRRANSILAAIGESYQPPVAVPGSTWVRGHSRRLICREVAGQQSLNGGDLSGCL